VDDGGGTELIASQDEPHGEEPEIAHVPADRQLPADFDATQEAGHLYIRPPGDGAHTPHTHTSHAHTCRMPCPRSLATPISHLPQRSAVRRRRASAPSTALP
jgi:hypothetical protein